MSIVTITKENFEAEVLNSKGTVLLDFWAAWCGPCRMLSPVIDEIAAERSDSLKVGKVNVDEQSELAVRYRIVSIPTVMIFKDGQPVQTSVGYVGKAQLEALL